MFSSPAEGASVILPWKSSSAEGGLPVLGRQTNRREGGRPRLKRCVSVPILQLRVESVTLSLTQCWTVQPLFVLPGDPVQPMTSDRDERSIEDYDLGADGPDEHDWTEPVTKVANVVLFITNLYLLYLTFFFIM